MRKRPIGLQRDCFSVVRKEEEKEIVAASILLLRKRDFVPNLNLMLYLCFLTFYLGRSCEPLSAPHNGAFLHVCSSVYGSVCRMGCNEEYEAFGSLERACTVNAQDIMGWTGTPLICRG